MAVGTGPLLPLYGHVEVVQKKKMVRTHALLLENLLTGAKM
jgi:hypothetical protein